MRNDVEYKTRGSMKLTKAVITAAGRGSRMWEITKVLPKALIPVYGVSNRAKVLIPIIDLSMGSLSKAGIKEFCIVAGDRHDVLEEHLKGSTLGKVSFESQREPKGFGAAVLEAEKFAGKDPFVLNTDDIAMTLGYDVIVKLFEKLDADAVFFMREVGNPKRYGVVEGTEEDGFMGHRVFRVTGVEEKPDDPKSNMVIVGLYAFSHRIFKALKDSQHSGPLELTAGIARLIKAGANVHGILLTDEVPLNVGDPDSYFKALSYTYEKAEKALKL